MNTKICNKCGNEKETSEFSVNKSKKDGLQSHCKECSKAANRKHYLKDTQARVISNRGVRKRLNAWYKEIKRGLSCCKCGENHPACLQFHHTDPSNKVDHVSILVRGGASRERIQAEISKCIVLCANCHFKTHYGSEA